MEGIQAQGMGIGSGKGGGRWRGLEKAGRDGSMDQGSERCMGWSFEASIHIQCIFGQGRDMSSSVLGMFVDPGAGPWHGCSRARMGGRIQPGG